MGSDDRDPAAPDDPRGERDTRAADFSRRALLRAGMALPAVLSFGALAAACGGESQGDAVKAATPSTKKRGSATRTGAAPTGGTNLAGSHGDAVHADHADGGHGDTPHSDHADAPHADHSDGGHADHADVDHVDTQHGDQVLRHADSHEDRGGGHLDEFHGDSPHDDVAHTDQPYVHGDHSDAFCNPIIGDGCDFTGSVAHQDVTHSDFSHVDEPHGDNKPSPHFDGHFDTPEGADSDSPHVDTAHVDST